MTLKSPSSAPGVGSTQWSTRDAGVLPTGARQCCHRRCCPNREELVRPCPGTADKPRRRAPARARSAGASPCLRQLSWEMRNSPTQARSLRDPRSGCLTYRPTRMRRPILRQQPRTSPPAPSTPWPSVARSHRRAGLQRPSVRRWFTAFSVERHSEFAVALL